MRHDNKWRKKLLKQLFSLDFSSRGLLTVADSPETAGLLIIGAAGVFDRCCLIVSDSHTAETIAAAAENLSALLEQPIPEPTLVPELQTERRSWIPENEALRAAAMSRAQSRIPALFIGSAVAFLSPAPSPAEFTKVRFSVFAGDDSQTLEKLLERLVELDYDNETEVKVPGEFSRRGGIVDIFSPLYEYPARIEFFGEEIDNIRFFNPETQRSLRDCQKLDIVPRGDKLVAPASSAHTFIDYLDFRVPLLLWRPQLIGEHLEKFTTVSELAEWGRFQDRHRSRIISISPPEESLADEPGQQLPWIPLGGNVIFNRPEIAGEIALLHWQTLGGNLRRWHQAGVEIVAACGNTGEAGRFREMLTQDPACREIPVNITSHRLDSGLYLPSGKAVLLGQAELFGKASRSDMAVGKSRYKADYRLDQDDFLHQGEYAVHASQGIAIYHGIKEIETSGVLQEVIELEFADHARLYVPMEQSWLVSRYIGGGRKPPQLSKIGGISWKKVRAAATDSAYDLAADLIRIEALRKNTAGFSYREDPHWESSFAAAFPFPETPDQTTAISEVLADMEKEEPMDRLLCGDVGYGKTEVAMRAAFRTVTNQRQTAVLVPTTLLAQQHYYAFRERMAEYPVNIEMLSRFRTEREQKEILNRLAEGRVDVIIGTHRLLQKDVVFSSLGLIVIDEEQRFGVKDKEKLKRLRASVDILTMTATPIPRTLYFSLGGIRNLSTIMTPPAERLPVTTVVARSDDDLIKRAVLREIERGGQVFYLHNRVRTIEAESRRLQHLLPEARLIVAHGRMPAHDLETAMQLYLQKEVDVMVCTTIIESGLDIPNANTIIIQDADRFGLAELYQLRGRVGRYHHQAYAYLLLSPLGRPAKNARERLSAIRQYTRLGAGMNLALRDLEIRGAGNLLGSQQSGHIAAVGFDFYCEILHEAVARLKNEPVMPMVRSVSVTLEKIVFGVAGIRDTGTGDREPAGIPAWYIESEQLRLRYYRRLSKLREEDEWRDFKDELNDRFGSLPRPVQNMLQIARLRLLAAARDIFSVAVRDDKLLLETPDGLWKDNERRLPRLQASEPRSQIAEIIAYLQNLEPASPAVQIAQASGTGTQTQA